MVRTSFALTAVVALAVPATAQADDYVVRSVVQTRATALPITGPLSDMRAAARARLVVPGDWRTEKAKAGSIAFMTPPASCRYVVTFTVSTRIGAAEDPVATAAARLTVPSKRYVLDEGTHNAFAFRVIRRTRTDRRVAILGLRTGVLTRRSDIVPSGQRAFADIDVTALSRKGDECHAGSWRERVGPQVGDVLATARTTLRFLP